MNDKQEAKFQELTGRPVGHLVCKMAVPTIISMMVTSCYNMVDTYFVGQLHAHRAGGAVAVHPSHEEGVRQVIEGGDHHADDAGNCQTADETAHGLGGHAEKLFLVGVHGTHLPFSDGRKRFPGDAPQNGAGYRHFRSG